MSKQAALLINLGSPDSTHVADVRRYLDEFLSDPRVIDDAFARKVVLPLIILNTRPKKSAAAYASVWTAGGSPLIVTSREQQRLLGEQVDVPVSLAMRYGKPSIDSVLGGLIEDGLEDLFIVPLYPQYAMSSYETVVVRCWEVIKARKPGLRVRVLEPFYQDPEYIEALATSARPHLDAPFDTLLFSFHGVPERHLRLGDSSRAHCLCVPDCCHQPSPAHATCYRHQCVRTAELLAAKLGLHRDQYLISYQSRLGRDPWLQPYTDETLERLAREGKKRVVVITPAFVTDCLETLEEIAEEGKETFLHAGGSEFRLIPCLNTHPDWIAWLSRRIRAHFGG